MNTTRWTRPGEGATVRQLRAVVHPTEAGRLQDAARRALDVLAEHHGEDYATNLALAFPARLGTTNDLERIAALPGFNPK